MSTSRIPQTVRMCVLSTFLALAASFLLAFGSASAHTSASAAQAASSTTIPVVRLVVNQQGGVVFSRATLTVKSGTAVKFVNKTPFHRFFTVNQRLNSISPNVAETFIITQSQVVTICGGGAMTITVV